MSSGSEDVSCILLVMIYLLCLELPRADLYTIQTLQSKKFIMIFP